MAVYVVALVLYGDVWDHGAFHGRTQWQQDPDLFSRGLQLWFHDGNSILPPFPTYATNTLDGLEPTIMIWGSWFERATGLLYWDIAYWTANDPWGPEISFGETGDGVLACRKRKGVGPAPARLTVDPRPVRAMDVPSTADHPC